MNTANKLTILRILLIPLFIAALLLPSVWEAFAPYAHWVAAVIFLAAAITDILDGKYARRHNLVTDFGKLMDPIADKILIVAAFVMLSCLTDEKHPRWLLHPVFGLVSLAVVMFLIFQAVYAWATPLMDAIEAGFAWLGAFVGSVLPEGPLASLLTDGIIAGVGGVVVFLPQILILFFFILLLEESGYLPRAALLLDRYALVGFVGSALNPGRLAGAALIAAGALLMHLSNAPRAAAPPLPPSVTMCLLTYHSRKSGVKQKSPPKRGSVGSFVSGRSESVLAQTADGAYPVIRDIFPGRAGSNAAVGIAGFRIIDIAAGTFVLHESEPPYFCFAAISALRTS